MIHSGLSFIMFAAFQVSCFRHHIDRVCNHDVMADSDRSRSHVPARDRPQPLPFFPRWCGPMSAVARHLHNTPRHQNRPSWPATQSGPYMMGRMWTPPVQLGIITTFSTNSTQYSSSSHSAISTTSPVSTDATMSTDPTLLTHDTVDLSVATTLDQHFTFWSATKNTQERSH